VKRGAVAYAERVLVEGRGRPLILLHGTMGPRVWDNMLAGLYEHFQVFVPTLPGFKPEDGPVVYSDRLCVEFVEGLRIWAGVQTWCVAGLSLGGRVAIEYALAHRDRVSHLVVIDPLGMAQTTPFFALPVVRDLVRPLIEQAFAHSWSWTATLPREVVDRKGPAARWAVSVGESVVADPVVRANVVGMLLRALAPKPRWRRLLPSLTVPTLVLSGSDDPTTPVENAYRLTSLLPDSRLVVLDGYRHCGVLEYPEFFTRHIIDFVAGPWRKPAVQ